LAKSKLAAMLTGDQNRLGQLAEQAGEIGKAATHYARGGDFSRALTLAAKAGSVPRAIRYAFQAALGADAEVPQDATARQAGELLKASGLSKEAIALFELSGAYGAAAAVATRLRQKVRAAHLYEKAGDWGNAAIYFEAEGRWADAVRMLGLHSRELEQRARTRRDPEARQKQREVDDRRAGLLAKLGRHDEAARTVSGQQATPASAAVLERSGRAEEAFESYLEMGELESAYRVLRSMKDLPAAERADLLQRCGRVKEAAEELSHAGLHADAARVFESLELWREAGRVWELAGDALAAGSALRRGGDFEGAAAFFKEAGRPELAADAFARLGRHSDAVTYYLQAGNAVEAAEAFQRNHQFTEAAAYFLHSGERDRAIEALAQVSPGSSEYHAACVRIATLLLEEGDAAQALEKIRQVPDDPREVGNAALDRLYWEGRCLEALERWEEARARYEELAAVAPEHEDVQSRLAGRSAGNPVFPGTVQIGVVLASRYRIEEEIGRGGMGHVYRAMDLELEEPVAIKVVHTQSEEDSPEESRLIREVQICRRLTHPNVVRMHDIGRFPGGLFISMELLAGESLAEAIRSAGQLPLERCKAILSEVLAGLREAHSQGVVHRDLKPQNIFLTGDGARVLDFGIAQGARFDTRLTLTGHAMGTPLYMAPEQLRGQEVDERTDLYALGVVAFEMLSGRPPFVGASPTEVALAHVQTPPPDLRTLRPGLPEAWAQWVHRLLSKEPDMRLPTAAHALNVAHALPI
jgi:tetratricopeptide (TPR) repeat protein